MKTAVCDAAEDDGAAEPQVYVGSDGGTVFAETRVALCSEIGLDDCCAYDADAKDVV
jgi:hypothetical protein